MTEERLVEIEAAARANDYNFESWPRVVEELIAEVRRLHGEAAKTTEFVPPVEVYDEEGPLDPFWYDSERTKDPKQAAVEVLLREMPWLPHEPDVVEIVQGPMKAPRTCRICFRAVGENSERDYVIDGCHKACVLIARWHRK